MSMHKCPMKVCYNGDRINLNVVQIGQAGIDKMYLPTSWALVLVQLDSQVHNYIFN